MCREPGGHESRRKHISNDSPMERIFYEIQDDSLDVCLIQISKRILFSYWTGICFTPVTRTPDICVDTNGIMTV